MQYLLSATCPYIIYDCWFKRWNIHTVCYYCWFMNNLLIYLICLAMVWSVFIFFWLIFVLVADIVCIPTTRNTRWQLAIRWNKNTSYMFLHILDKTITILLFYISMIKTHNQRGVRIFIVRLPKRFKLLFKKWHTK